MDRGSEALTSPSFGAAAPVWNLILVCLIADVLIKLAVGLTFKFAEILGVIAIVVAALGLSAFYTYKRPDERIARLFRAGVELFLLTFLVGSLSYSAATFSLPLWDDAFSAWDHVLGFDWRHWLDVLDGHPQINLILVLAYHSMWPQLTLILLALVTMRAYGRLDIFLLAFGIGAIATVIIAGLMPAVGPRAFLGITSADHPHITLALSHEFEDQAAALRAGTLRAIDMGNAQGLVTFPSFHTVTAVLLLLGFRGVPYLRWVGLIANGLMLIAIPIQGSHYLVDVIAGVAVALAAWAAASKAVTLCSAKRDPQAMLNPAKAIAP